MENIHVFEKFKVNNPDEYNHLSESDSEFFLLLNLKFGMSSTPRIVRRIVENTFRVLQSSRDVVSNITSTQSRTRRNRVRK